MYHGCHLPALLGADMQHCTDTSMGRCHTWEGAMHILSAPPCLRMRLRPCKSTLSRILEGLEILQLCILARSAEAIRMADTTRCCYSKWQAHSHK